MDVTKSRPRRRGRAPRVLAALLAGIMVAAAAAPGVGAAGGASTAGIVSRGGAVMGSLTLTPLADGRAVVDLAVRGFDPVAGEHRLVLTDAGRCVPPALGPAGNVIAVLPAVRLAADGSATYRATSDPLPWALLSDADGAGVLLYADQNPAGEVIGCAALAPGPGAPPAPAPPPVTPPAGYGPATTVTAGAGLRVRAAAGLGAAVLAVLPRGALVYRGAATTVANGILWAAVWAPRGGRPVEGWAAASYLGGGAPAPHPVPTSPPPPTPTPPPGPWPPAGLRYMVTAQGGLRLRDGPGLGYPVRCAVPYGTVLYGSGAEGYADGLHWAEVRLPAGGALWAARDYLYPF
ncbi:MAG: SH3 domain-containing protein [Chloroflexi bacterium]|jgi:hypothetical protein|nr:SH3 domain-containing protein [Chloroflexota bacterium]